MIRDGETENYDGLDGSSDFVKDCDHEARLVVLFKEADEDKSVVALSRTVPRNSTPPEERVFIDENDILQIITDPCLSPPSIKLLPDKDDLAPRRISVEKPISTREVAWEGCTDYQVEVTRPSHITNWNILRYPGWKNLLVDWSLKVDTVDDKSITFQPLEKACKVDSIKLEIDCNDGRVHANKKFESNQWAEDLLVDHLVSGARYECRARLLDSEGGKEVAGPWTKGTKVNTTEEVVRTGPMLAASDKVEE